MKDAQTAFAALVESLRRDGATDEARQMDELLRHVAWTTGSEFLGEFGLAMKALKAAHWNRMSDNTKSCFRDAAAAVRKAWPRIRL
jgi:hypothetical protein